jgi:hypothetical protein
MTKGDDWHERDQQSWSAAAKALRDDGWHQKPHSYRNATFHKDGEVVVLVRHLAELDWHPTPLDTSEVYL